MVGGKKKLGGNMMSSKVMRDESHGPSDNEKGTTCPNVVEKKEDDDDDDAE